MKHWLPSLFLIIAPAFSQAQVFAPPVTYSNGSGNPGGVALADINGDGLRDIVCANTGSSSILLMLGNGNGTFRFGNGYLTGTNSSPKGVAVADLNGDNLPDIVTANSYTGTAGVMLSSGSGRFQPITAFAAGGGARSVFVADLNGDARLDIVTANYNAGTLGVLLGNGNGTFQPVTAYPTEPGRSGSPSGVAVGDVNGDNRPDLVFSDDGLDAAGVCLGNGNGTFQTASRYQTGLGPSAVALGDVNGDNRPDIVTINNYSSNAGVLLGNGNGTFQPVTAYRAGPSGDLCLSLTDVNGDNRLDIVTANFNASYAAVLLGNGNGTFQPFTTFTTGPSSYPTGVATGDVNGDGKPDIVTVGGMSALSVLTNQTPVVTSVTVPLLQARPTLFPNPAVGDVMLTAAGLPAQAHALQVSVVDALGHVRRQADLPVTGGAVRATVITAGLSPGAYVVRLVTSDARGGTLGVLPVQRLSIR